MPSQQILYSARPSRAKTGFPAHSVVQTSYTTPTLRFSDTLNRLVGRVEPIMLIFSPIILFCSSHHYLPLFHLFFPIIPLIFSFKNLFTTIHGRDVLEKRQRRETEGAVFETRGTGKEDGLDLRDVLLRLLNLSAYVQSCIIIRIRIYIRELAHARPPMSSISLYIYIYIYNYTSQTHCQRT